MLLSLLALPVLALLLLPVPPFLAGLPLPPVDVEPVESAAVSPPPPPPQAERIAALTAVRMMVLILVLIADILSPFFWLKWCVFIKRHKSNIIDTIMTKTKCYLCFAGRWVSWRRFVFDFCDKRLFKDIERLIVPCRER
ncbi:MULTISPECIES: hypothetical protein [Neisseriaceae]|uniref:hypothetical protein n=1 Tax=Neisseriaceae TaxID=481 RepID=UPI001FD5DF4E|nr:MULTISPECIES: hypothetical protein [Neisseriaceae]